MTSSSRSTISSTSTSSPAWAPARHARPSAPTPNNPAGRIDSYLPRVILAEPVERKFLKALKNSDIEALEFDAQLDEGVREGWITADERKQLEELRSMTLDAITVDDFESWELRAASFERAVDVSRAAA